MKQQELPTKYAYNHTVRAEITEQHAGEVSSRPQMNGIRTWTMACAKALEWVNEALAKKQKINVWIDEVNWYRGDHPRYIVYLEYGAQS